MKIQYHPDFFKNLKKLDVKIRKSFRQRITTFLKNPYNSELNNHELKDKYQGYRSIDITADYRAIYEEIDINTAYFFSLEHTINFTAKHQRKTNYYLFPRISRSITTFVVSLLSASSQNVIIAQ